MLLSLALLLPLAPAALASETEDHDDLGITLTRPAGYEALPVSPDEQWVVLSYVDSTIEVNPAPGETVVRPIFHVVVIPRADSPVRFGQTGRDKSIVDVGTYLRRELPSWRTETLRGGRDRWGHQQRRFDLLPGTPSDPPLAGYVHAWEGPERTVALIGFSAKDDFEMHAKLWRRTGETMKLVEPEAKDDEVWKLERHYARERFSHPEYRIAVRQALVEGWEVTDTENYIIVDHTDDEGFVRAVVKDIELLRREYARVFPPAAGFDTVSTVRICRDRAEYLAYGGAPTTAGYWNAGAEELVLYVNASEGKAESTDHTNSLMVVYHEAFHQFIHYSAGQLPPHSWYDEGNGDYFSGAAIEGGRVLRIDVHPWRLAVAKDLVRRRAHATWEALTAYSQHEFYASSTENYAQAWSMVYFLRTSEEVRREPRWRRVLPAYFATLKKAWADERTRLGYSSSRTRWARAAESARERALAAAFEGIDLAALEAAWIGFVEGL